MKIISLNIEKDLHFDKIIKFYHEEKPDVFCVQELLERDYPRFEQALGVKSVFQVCRRDNSPNYPLAIGQKQGLAIFSKNIIDSGHEFYFGDPKDLEKEFDPSISNNSEAFVWADIKNTGEEVYRFVVAHLPVTRQGESSPLQLDAVEKLINKLDSFGEFVFCGDMNAPRGGETFSRLANKYIDRIPREFKGSLDKNLHRVGPEKFITEGMNKYMVDVLFTTPKYEAENVHFVDGLSDHMAVVGEINKLK